MATTAPVGASRDPGEPHPQRSTEQSPVRAVKTQAPEGRHGCWRGAGHRPAVRPPPSQPPEGIHVVRTHVDKGDMAETGANT